MFSSRVSGEMSSQMSFQFDAFFRQIMLRQLNASQRNFGDNVRAWPAVVTRVASVVAAAAAAVAAGAAFAFGVLVVVVGIEAVRPLVVRHRSTTGERPPYLMRQPWVFLHVV